jgi:hypothetical protein
MYVDWTGEWRRFTMWLTVLGVLGSLGIGAFIGAFTTHRLREKADRKREKREGDALLRLLLEEVNLNTTLLNSSVREGEEEESAQTASRYLSFTTTETWRATRVRATQLIPEHLLQSLVEYYSPLEALLIMLWAKGPGTEAGERWFRSILQKALGDEKVAVPPTVKQARKMLKAQKEVQKKIADYLGISLPADQ